MTAQRDKELDLYIKLTPKLNEYRGEWQVGDRIFNLKRNEIELFMYFGLQAVDSNYAYVLVEKDCIWLPLPIDPLDQERIARGEKPRGLWGMVNGCVHLIGEYSSETDINWLVSVTVGDEERLIAAASPTEALLLALRKQWKEGEK